MYQCVDASCVQGLMRPPTFLMLSIYTNFEKKMTIYQIKNEKIILYSINLIFNIR